MTSAAAHNRKFYGRGAIARRHAALDRLFPAEQAVLDRLRGELAGYDMLDLGVGGGRTSVHFAPGARAYQGVDYVPAMIEACKMRFAQTLPQALFTVGDVRGLPAEWTWRFDFVLFSYNGIDCVGAEDRPLAFKEIARVMRPGARLCFSAHNLNAVKSLKEWARRPGLGGKLAARLDYGIYRLLNPDLNRLLESDGSVLRDRGNRLRGRNYYIRPAAQIRQLDESGFRVQAVYPAGKASPFPRPDALSDSTDQWLYYLCEKRGS